jgi:ribonuclease HI
MIEIYYRSGIKHGQRAIAFILKSSKYRLLKTRKIEREISRNEIESVGLIYALNHIISRYKKKKVIVYSDSKYLRESLKKKNQFEYANRTKVQATASLRDVIGTFKSIEFKNPPQNDHMEELEHVYEECCLDGIELTEN